MQVKILYEPFALADLYQDADVLVLPIFIDVELESCLYFDYDERVAQIRGYLKSRGVDVIWLPDNIVVMFAFVKPKHNKKRILKKALHLYMSSIDEDFQEFDSKMPGLHSTLLCVASGDPLSDYFRMPKNRFALSIYSGCEKLDRVYRRLIRRGELDKFTPAALAHPTVRVTFERTLVRIGKNYGFDVEIISVIRHGRKALVTCDTMDLEVS